MTMAVSKAVEDGRQGDHLRLDRQHVSASAAAYAARAGHHLRGARAAGQDRARQAGPGARARRQAAAGRRQLRRLPGAGLQAVAGLPGRAGQLGQHRTACTGQKTAAFEIVDALGDAPDIHCLPVGNAGNITAYWMGYRRGPRRPATPRSGRRCSASRPPAPPRSSTAQVVREPSTIATAIRIGNPASLDQGARRPRRVRRPDRRGDRPGDPRGVPAAGPRGRRLRRAGQRGQRRRPAAAGRGRARAAPARRSSARSPATASRTRSGRSPPRPSPTTIENDVLAAARALDLA